jgi:putative phosphoribosyl transferase
MNSEFVYRNRQEAGKILGERLTGLVTGSSVVLSLPRGGTIVGGEVAAILGAEHDLIVSRKIGSPFNPEAAIGALTQDGVFLKNLAVINALKVSPGYLEEQCRIELIEIGRRLTQLRGDKPFPELKGKTAIIVDDGIATGFTMEAAIVFIKAKQPKIILVAIPVGPNEEIERLSKLVNAVVCPMTPELFLAVGNHYEDFHQISDHEVREILTDL